MTIDDLTSRLDQLEGEHRELDSLLEAMTANGLPDQIAVARSKKRKLRLKDDIARIRRMLIPDIIA